MGNITIAVFTLHQDEKTPETNIKRRAEKMKKKRKEKERKEVRKVRRI